MEFHHISVLLNETVNALNVKPNGIYVDCTAGGGGHSSKLLESLESGRLIAVDQDPEAIENLRDKFKDSKNVTVVHDNFVNINSVLDSLGIDKVDGIMADLGVSSYQLDTDERGFSYHKDAPLDMRMSKEGTSAYDLVNSLTQQQIQKILFSYGDEKFAPAISRSIVKEREKKSCTGKNCWCGHCSSNRMLDRIFRIFLLSGEETNHEDRNQHESVK